MSLIRLFGIVAFVIGLSLLGFAHKASTAPMEQLSNTLLGRYSDETMWYFFLGLAAVLGGGMLAFVRTGK